MILTRGQLALLRLIEASEDGEMVHEDPGGWWVDDQQVSGRVAWALLRLILIHEDDLGGKLRIYTLNEHGRQAVKTGRLPDELAVILARAHAGAALPPP